MASVSAADSYFEGRLWTDKWDEASTEKKEAALSHAEKIIPAEISSKFTIEEYNNAIYEQALYLLSLGIEDRERAKLQSQGVTQFSISGGVSETYKEQKGNNFICPYVKELVNKYKYQIGEMI